MKVRIICDGGFNCDAIGGQVVEARVTELAAYVKHTDLAAVCPEWKAHIAENSPQVLEQPDYEWTFFHSEIEVLE